MSPRLLGAAVVALALSLTVPAGAAAAPSSPTITYYFGLERPEAAARAAFFAVGDPGSAAYRRFLPLQELARTYGASPATRHAFRRALRRRGFTVRFDPSGVFARVRGSVRRFERVFDVRIRRAFDNDVLANAWVVAGGGPLHLPRDVAPLVRDVVPVFSRSTTLPSAPSAATASAQPAPAGAPRNRGTWTHGCRAARATQAYSFRQVRHAYGIDAAGNGTGARVAILNAGEGVPAADRRVFARCFGLGPIRTHVRRSDGQARPFGRGSFEPQEDLALVRGMAPRLGSVLFAQVWLTPELWFLGPADVLSRPRLPDTFSISYGECEAEVRGPSAGASTRAAARLMDALLVRLGLAGVGTFAAAGDFGSTCNGQPFRGVTWPASSPFLTAVGGTRLVLDRANRRTREVAWNDLRWTPADSGGGAGGGGFATYSARPPYQRGLGLGGSRRALPDVAAHASSFPAWPVNIEENWVTDGGTSASTPLIASAFAVLSARERAAGRPPLGPVNGLLYALRAGAPATLFDVTSGRNHYAPGVPGWRAGPGYDVVTGLGVPRFRAVAGVLAP